ncbi:UNKNOWN [Stylonychia lemnae]|uniref:EF-hand domain-containing protein n=1 Tax=Stylonychia lemnae TaxID=5949 RepID=A0A078A0I6_STYLE|nr:UNKNOWN [Stylonychia lemnae]|eukprot:CDW74293.1 UNKNOWN [Stylonychia lemnae]
MMPTLAFKLFKILDIDDTGKVNLEMIQILVNQIQIYMSDQYLNNEEHQDQQDQEEDELYQQEGVEQPQALSRFSSPRGKLQNSSRDLNRDSQNRLKFPKIEQSPRVDDNNYFTSRRVREQEFKCQYQSDDEINQNQLSQQQLFRPMSANLVDAEYYQIKLKDNNKLEDQQFDERDIHLALEGNSNEIDDDLSSIQHNHHNDNANRDQIKVEGKQKLINENLSQAMLFSYGSSFQSQFSQLGDEVQRALESHKNIHNINPINTRSQQVISPIECYENNVHIEYFNDQQNQNEDESHNVITQRQSFKSPDFNDLKSHLDQFRMQRVESSESDHKDELKKISENHKRIMKDYENQLDSNSKRKTTFLVPEFKLNVNQKNSIIIENDQFNNAYCRQSFLKKDYASAQKLSQDDRGFYFKSKENSLNREERESLQSQQMSIQKRQNNLLAFKQLDSQAGSRQISAERFSANLAQKQNLNSGSLLNPLKKQIEMVFQRDYQQQSTAPTSPLGIHKLQYKMNHQQQQSVQQNYFSSLNNRKIEKLKHQLEESLQKNTKDSRIVLKNADNNQDYYNKSYNLNHAVQKQQSLQSFSTLKSERLKDQILGMISNGNNQSTQGFQLGPKIIKTFYKNPDELTAKQTKLARKVEELSTKLGLTPPKGNQQKINTQFNKFKIKTALIDLGNTLENKRQLNSRDFNQCSQNNTDSLPRKHNRKINDMYDQEDRFKYSLKKNESNRNQNSYSSTNQQESTLRLNKFELSLKTSQHAQYLDSAETKRYSCLTKTNTNGNIGRNLNGVFKTIMERY